MGAPIKIGVSACLLGERVRYDGGHKHDRYITDVLGKFFSFVPVCPEVECGLPIPRESMRLEGDVKHPRLITNKTRIDKTEQMQIYCHAKVKALENEDLCGFIFKKDSPSSGLFRVKVYHEGMPSKSGSGLFAAAVAEHFPHLPLEEEGRLNDPSIRENFIERVFCYRRWKDLLAEHPDLGKLVEFHSRHKLLIMSHSVQCYRDMGALVAHGKEKKLPELLECYEDMLMTALELQATVKKHTNVLTHIMGYFKHDLDAAEKQELLAVIGRYHDGMVPLVVPLTLLTHYVNKYDKPYLKQQIYLAPHPVELMLRNHA
jgi:uncharacterized protein YbgA (DUF1722 family)/uncharacterized protein YbbK (DUF523 family)